MDIEQVGRARGCKEPLSRGLGSANLEEAARLRCLAPEDSYTVEPPCFEPVNRQMLLTLVRGKTPRL